MVHSQLPDTILSFDLRDSNNHYKQAIFCLGLPVGLHLNYKYRISLKTRSEHMKPRVSQVLSIAVLTLGLAVGLGCAEGSERRGVDGSSADEVQPGFRIVGEISECAGGQWHDTLTGAVDNEMQRDAAAHQAAAVPGVKEVINNLQVAAPAALAGR